MTDYQKSLKAFQRTSTATIADTEFKMRIEELQTRMLLNGVRAVWLDASSSLTYYTGLSLGLSERVHGALIPASGPITYVSPYFEEPKLRTLLRIPGDIVVWHEHDDPFTLIAGLVASLSGSDNSLALDPATPFVFASALMGSLVGMSVISAQPMIAAQRQIKSVTEIALIQAAMDASYAVQKAVHAGLRTGISTVEVANFVNQAHLALGLQPQFVAVQFGAATAYPHGVPYAQNLADGDMVLIDLGGSLHGYQSDITRTYVFGSATARQRQLWALEHQAHRAAFNAAQLGATCGSVDAAARRVLTEAGFGPGYQVPGLPHRTGHGLGLNGHEEPYIVQGNTTRLAPGMCFSIEPMLCVYGECGVRLEDIAYMTEAGPRWFSTPAECPEQPFGV